MSFYPFDSTTFYSILASEIIDRRCGYSVMWKNLKKSHEEASWDPVFEKLACTRALLYIGHTDKKRVYRRCTPAFYNKAEHLRFQHSATNCPQKRPKIFKYGRGRYIYCFTTRSEKVAFLLSLFRYMNSSSKRRLITTIPNCLFLQVKNVVNNNLNILSIAKFIVYLCLSAS